MGRRSVEPVAQIQASIKIDPHAVYVQQKSNEIARQIQQIFCKAKACAKELVWNETIPSWFLGQGKYTSASPEVVEIWDNVYAIIHPDLLDSMEEVTCVQCENAFYKGFAGRYKRQMVLSLLESSFGSVII